jgi:HEAT repeat protein
VNFWQLLRLLQLLASAGVFAWRVFNGSRSLGSPLLPGPEPDPKSHPPYAVAVEACGLTQVARGFNLRGPTLEGRSGSLRVRLERKRSANEEQVFPETRVFVEHVDSRPVPITLRRQAQGFLDSGPSGRELEIGDKGFDDEFHVTGPHTFVRALLDAPTRRLLRSLLLEADLTVVRGQVSARIAVTTTWALHEFALARMLGYLLQVARHFERPQDLVQRLANNARLDPLPEVRLQNLLTLVREYPEEPVTQEALVAASADASDWIRVRAATALGEDGRATLLEVAGRDPGDDAAASQAVTVLGRSLAPERVRDILARALRNRQQGIARACLAALGEGSRGDEVALMSKVMSMEKGDLAVAAADALGSTGSPAAEPPLLAALERDIPDLRVAAARALGRVGTAAAVVPLKEAEARAADSVFSRAARQAIAEIQSRLPGASPGQLSMASGEAGTLSLVEDERGRLSLPADHDHQ